MFQSAMRDGLQSLQNIGTDDILAALGLQRRRSAFDAALVPSIALFAAGALVGAATAMLLAPKSGQALRKELSAGAKDLGQRIGSTANSVVQEMREALPFGDDDKKSAGGAGPNSTHTTRHS
jgi:hypothetical protein